jgi:hypothetical protein
MNIVRIERAPAWQARSVFATASSAAAIGLVTASAGFGAVYAWTTGSTHGYILGGLTVLFALALEVAKPLAVQGFFSAARTWAFGQALCLAVLAVLAVAYSLTAELSLMASVRSDTVATRQAQTRAAAEHDKETAAREREQARVEQELRLLGSARPVAELEGLAANLPKRCKIEVTLGTRRTVCTRNASLDAEIGRAKRREQLEQALERLTPGRTGVRDSRATSSREASAPVPVPVKDDPAAEALATYLALIGLHVRPATITEWLILVPVLALEVGSALAAVLARMSPVDEAPGRRAAGTGFAKTSAKGASGATATQLMESPAVQGEPAAERSSPKPRRTARDRLLEMLSGAKGPLRVGQEGLAEALGVTSARVRQLLKELAAAGAIRVRTSPAGTTISLAGGQVLVEAGPA